MRNYILKNLPFRRYQFWGRNRPSAATTFPTSLMSLTCSPMRWDFPLILRHFTEPPYLHVAGSFKAVLLEVQFILFRSSHYFSICAEFVCRLHCSFSPSLPPPREITLQIGAFVLIRRVEGRKQKGPRSSLSLLVGTAHTVAIQCGKKR